jgi:hypothetical protein
MLRAFILLALIAHGGETIQDHGADRSIVSIVVSHGLQWDRHFALGEPLICGYSGAVAMDSSVHLTSVKVDGADLYLRKDIHWPEIYERPELHPAGGRVSLECATSTGDVFARDVVLPSEFRIMDESGQVLLSISKPHSLSYTPNPSIPGVHYWCKLNSLKGEGKEYNILPDILTGSISFPDSILHQLVPGERYGLTLFASIESEFETKRHVYKCSARYQYGSLVHVIE